MRIAIDVSPIDENSESGHKVRGVGKYITLLKENLLKYDKLNEYIFTTDTKRVDADVIHYPYFDPFFINLPIHKRIPTVVTVHDVIPLTHKKNFPVGMRGNIKWILNRSILRKVDAVITDSNASKKQIEKVVGYESRKIHPIYLAADPSFRKLILKEGEKQKIIEKYKIPRDFVLYVGDVTWNKNLPRLITAIKRAGIPLVMVGKALAQKDFDRTNLWNSDRIKVEELSSENNQIYKIGFVDNEDLVKIYNLAQALIMPSLDEGFGLPVLEAMQSGCPVICSREGSLPEVGGDAAVYCDAYSAEDIADKLSQGKLLKEMLSSKGIEQAKKFTLEKMILQTINIYNSIKIEK